ncbi:MAG: BspA family leucine-rich repeat surface protein [Anaerolineaceae bacterium]|nr:BspA family leucine-rich repeat surface protein [Anaerolineaceae bacterium]
MFVMITQYVYADTLVTEAQINDAIRWANQFHSGYGGECGKYVHAAFNYGAGIYFPGADCAYGSGFTGCNTSMLDNMKPLKSVNYSTIKNDNSAVPRGALIFYGSNNNAINCYGHVGIYDGNGNICDATWTTDENNNTIERTGCQPILETISSSYCYDKNGNNVDGTNEIKGWSFYNGYTLYSEKKVGVLDVNGILDGITWGSTSINDTLYGTFDVYINGNLVADDKGDYYDDTLEEGITYRITDIKASDGFIYKGYENAELTGTITANERTDVYLKFNKFKELYTGVILYNSEGIEIIQDLGADYCYFDVYIDGILSADDVSTDYWNNKIELGTSYEIKNIVPADGYVYKGLADGSDPLSGTNTGQDNTVIKLKIVPAGTLNVDGLLDEIQLGGTEDYGTFDVYINDQLVADDVTDYWNSGLEAGSSYEIADITPLNGKSFTGLADGSALVKGTITAGKITSVNLKFDTENDVPDDFDGYFGVPAAKYDPCQVSKQMFRLSLVKNIDISPGTWLYYWRGGQVQIREGDNVPSKDFLFYVRKCVNDSCDEVEATSAYVYGLNGDSTFSDNTIKAKYISNEQHFSIFNMKLSPFTITNVWLVVDEPGTYVIYAFAPNVIENNQSSFYERIYTTIELKDDQGTCTQGVCGTLTKYSIDGNTITFSKVASDIDAIWGEDCGNMFKENPDVTEVEIKDKIIVTDAQLMFKDFKYVKKMNLSNFDVSNVTSMNNMFLGCSSLTSLDLNSWDTSSLTNMSSLFNLCSSLTDLNMNGWNTSAVTTTNNMFNGCRSLTSLDLSDWNMSSVTDMRGMFYHCTSLTDLDLGGWNTSNVTNMMYMFTECSSLKNLNVNGWNTDKVTDMGGMFNKCGSIKELDLSSWNSANVTNLDTMFGECNNLDTLALGEKTLEKNLFEQLPKYNEPWYYLKSGTAASTPLPLGTVKNSGSLFTDYDFTTMAGTWSINGGNEQGDDSAYYTYSIDTEQENTEDPVEGIGKGNGQNHLIGSGLSSVFTIKRNEGDENTFDLFKGIRTDGEDVDQKYWKAEKGSVKITLFSEYLDTLSTGDHIFTAVFEDGTHDINFSVSEPFVVPVKFTSIRSDGSYFIPSDLKDMKILMTIIITGSGVVSKAENIELDLSLLEENKDVTIDVLFDQAVEEFSNNHKVNVTDYSQSLDADIYVEDGSVPQYHLKIEGAPGQIDNNKFGINLFLIWNDFNNSWEPEIIAVYALPEDEIGAYAEGPDGVRTYLIFQTYDICMKYLGSDELCSGNERCYHK